MTTFTVAIPTHNRRETVVLAVLSTLRQTLPPEQVIVTCDGCTDGTAEALRALGDPRVVAIELEKGRGYAYGYRNIAVEQATGELILWLADDDLLLPDHLERLAERQAVDDLDMVTSPAIVVEPDDSLAWNGRDLSVPHYRWWCLERGCTSVMAAVAVRTSLIREVGGWDDTIERAADWDLWKRVLSTGARAGMTDEPTVLHFKATGRTQEWDDRVAQNTSWLERIGRTGELPALRRQLRRTRAVDEASVHAGHVALEAAVAALQAQLDQQTARATEAEQRLGETRAEADRHRVTLEAIYAGGWWRLRGIVRRLTAPLRALRRTAG